MDLYSGLHTAVDLRLQIAKSAKTRRLTQNVTQQELARRSGVSLATLKRFEKDGSTSLNNLLAIAEALDALDEFHQLFPEQDATSLAALETSGPVRQRARKSS